MAKLKNLKRRMRVFNLEHPAFTSVTGANGLGKPESLTLLPLEAKEVSTETLACREIAAALSPKSGRPTLRVIG